MGVGGAVVGFGASRAGGFKWRARRAVIKFFVREKITEGFGIWILGTGLARGSGSGEPFSRAGFGVSVAGNRGGRSVLLWGQAVSGFVGGRPAGFEVWRRGLLGTVGV